MARLLFSSLLMAGIAAGQSVADEDKFVSRMVARGVDQIGRIEAPAITESSGLAASRRHAGVFWTHNDKGSKPRLFAITREGRLLAEFSVEGAKFSDWEDIAIDDAGHLYLGDIGNNNLKREDVEVYRIDEPDPKSSDRLHPDTKWRLTYPGKPFDAESLFVFQGKGYLISKVTNDRLAEVYCFPLGEQKEVPLEKIVQIPVSSPVTGADISADGQRLGLVCKAGAYVFRINGDIAKAGLVRPWHTRYRHEAIEACCFVPEGLLATAETREIFLFTDAPFR
jgi:hypothetical protein